MDNNNCDYNNKFNYNYLQLTITNALKKKCLILFENNMQSE